jgi:Acetyltransferase (GNAT) domain
MTPVLQTERLTLREFDYDDLDDLAAMVGDEEQMSFYPRPKRRDEAAAWIGRNLDLYERYGFGVWAIEHAATSPFAGYCGIKPLRLDGAAEIEMAWHVKKTFWKRGLPRRPRPPSETSPSEASGSGGSSRSSLPTTSPRGASRRTSVCASRGRPPSRATPWCSTRGLDARRGPLRLFRG